MNDMTVCGNNEALVSYLYDECDAVERDAIAAHLALCASCAEEIGSLRDTRAHLASWTPPALPLGFQITRTEAEAPAKVLRPVGLSSRSSQSEGWWKQPLPAWAQVAAAALIFAAGMSVNALRSPSAAPVVSSAQPASQPARAAAVVSLNDLARLDARLRAVEGAERTERVQLPRTAGGSIDERALLMRLSDLVDDRIAESEQRQYRVIDRVARGLNSEATERVSLMEEELLEQRQAIIRVAATRSSGGDR